MNSMFLKKREVKRVIVTEEVVNFLCRDVSVSDTDLDAPDIKSVFVATILTKKNSR
jgi:hypothetical protein